MLSYLIVGSGYRSEYFARVAAKHPDLFRAMFLCRSAEKAAAVTARTGVPATASPDEALAFGPDFAVVAVDRGHVADVTAEWAERGFAVVAETPVGSTPEQVERIEALSRRGAKIVCCEQYHRRPVMANGLRLVKAGLIGEPRSLYLSLAHDYHGISLIRQLLGTHGESYDLQVTHTAGSVIATDSRYGAILDGSAAAEDRDIVVISFSSGKTALYDFSPVQYRSFIRTRHLTLRGERGEWNDRVIAYADRDNRPQRAYLMGDLPEAYRCLDSQSLRDLRKTWTPELFLDTEQDEYAIATVLLDMEGYLKGGPSPYPIEEALDDARFWIRIRRE